MRCIIIILYFFNIQIKSLQEKLSQFQDEFMQMEAECVTLRQMLEEKNAFITTMKSEVYRKEYRNDTQRVDLQSQILQKEAVIKKLEVRAVCVCVCVCVCV